ncbi:MBL fold metallo-hydrolase [Pseudidiomarina terrestris]|uniref:MBL fold metallo-hydrolase n=1 Tax=Pseudidiomarina terrestris TaxID=2820060 RepID=A0AAW7R163_9GAMM|nr:MULTISPECIES: MBL fold metallo-hydrolase [unclassified Pseudidiomarina]MDN7125436.1 MBL fold metallo-hydrolase [Pseudidiomarina sp. 1APP75-32.1]MDN7128044.1 MBL fold metallo-hydrolase [Pseudidiomarina sp. 1APR75-33.1]MDN7130194.1 MBL fold metallo-hydrolase [Pseudidiomarina sp. 1APR75-15]MDN7135703.1 MBL fold metallo-hydrolase [Pseudidiomarina sp. 1ASP75-5]MDN7137259.1 MBL fold metallo-hydrolase [Pseudidiomarina sp. 1ASP75-14]
MSQAAKPHVEAFLDSDSETFSYVVCDPTSKKAVIIDPVLDFDYKSGRTSTEGAQRLVDYVRAHELELEWVLETHAHADHLSAAPYIKDALGGKIAIGEHIRDVQKLFKEVFDLEKEFLPNGAQFDQLFSDGDTFSVGSMEFRVLHTPGHTPADVAYIINEQMAFVGDTLFMPDVGTARCDFPGGSAATLYQSIKKLLALPAATDIYICHDYPPAGRSHECRTTVADQRAHSKHVHDGVSEAEFVTMREQRDASLAMPRLILPSIQVNIRAGEMPPADAQGKVYLKLPINQL